MALTDEETRKAIKNNDPPIEINQIWTISDSKGTLRGLRILGLFPSVGDERTDEWIYCDLPSRVYKFGSGRISLVPEYNLRRLFTLEGVYGATSH